MVTNGTIGGLTNANNPDGSTALVKMHNDGRLASLQKKWFGVAMDAPTTMPTPNY